MLLVLIIPYAEILVNKKLQRRRFRRRFFLPFCSDPDRRAGDSYLSAFRAASPWRPFSPPISSNTEKAACGFPFYFFHIPEARPPGFPVSMLPLSPLLRGLGARSQRPRAILYITNIYNNVCLTGAFFKLFWGSFFRRKFAF